MCSTLCYSTEIILFRTCVTAKHISLSSSVVASCSNRVASGKFHSLQHEHSSSDAMGMQRLQAHHQLSSVLGICGYSVTAGCTAACLVLAASCLCAVPLLHILVQINTINTKLKITLKISFGHDHFCCDAQRCAKHLNSLRNCQFVYSETGEHLAHIVLKRLLSERPDLLLLKNDNCTKLSTEITNRMQPVCHLMQKYHGIFRTFNLRCIICQCVALQFT